MNQRRKNVARPCTASRSASGYPTVYSSTIHGASTMPRIAIAVSATIAIVNRRRTTSHARSRPRDCIHSTTTGTTTEVRIPPSASSYRMFGVMFATLYASARRVSVMPIAKAIADSRRKPVSRDIAVPVDITIVLRTNDRVESSGGGSARVVGGGRDGGSPPGVRPSVRSSAMRSSGPLWPRSDRHEASRPHEQEHERRPDRDQQRDAVVRGRTHDEGLLADQASARRDHQHVHLEPSRRTQAGVEPERLGFAGRELDGRRRYVPEPGRDELHRELERVRSLVRNRDRDPPGLRCERHRVHRLERDIVHGRPYAPAGRVDELQSLGRRG